MTKRNNILFKTNGVICIIIVIGFILTAILSYRINYSSSLKNIEQVSTLTSEGIYYQLTTTFSKPIHVSLTMANDNLLEEYLAVEMTQTDNDEYINRLVQYLDAYQKKYDYDSVFLVSAQTNRYYNFNGINRIITPDNSENTWYYELLESDSDNALKVDNDEAAYDEITVFVNCKIKNDEEETIGVVGVGMRLESLQALFKEYEDNFDISAYLINDDGNIEISTQYSGFEEINFFELNHVSHIKNDVLSWYSEEQAKQFWTSSNQDNSKDDFIVTRFIDDLSWHLVIERDTSSLVQSFYQQLFQTALVIGIIIVCILLVVTKVIKGFNLQIEERNKAFRKATEKLYDNIYELNITKNCSANASTQRYFESLGAASDLPYDEALKVIAQEQIKEEFRKGYIDTFCTENVLKQYESGQTDLQYDFQITQDGLRYYWMRIDALVYYNKEDHCVHMFTYRKDIDEEKRQKLKMSQLASYDRMTGLYNRGSTQNIIEELLQQNPAAQYAFFILDIDNFKRANDKFGHAYGDFVLIEFANLLKKYFKTTDIIGRLGGDEFVVFAKVSNIDQVIKKAEEISEILHHVSVFEGHALPISASIGIALAPQNGNSFKELYKKADVALYEVKNTTKNGFLLYDQVKKDR